MTKKQCLQFIEQICADRLQVDVSPVKDLKSLPPNHLLFNAHAQLYLYCEIARKVGRFPPDEWLLGGGFSDMEGLLDWMVKTTEKQAVPASA